MLILAAAMIGTLASLGLPTTLAHAVTCEVQQLAKLSPKALATMALLAAALQAQEPGNRGSFGVLLQSYLQHPGWAVIADDVVAGTFRGQGPDGSRGPVEFRIKGTDVVVTTPDGQFVTVLRDGINNPSVQAAINQSR